MTSDNAGPRRVARLGWKIGLGLALTACAAAVGWWALLRPRPAPPPAPERPLADSPSPPDPRLAYRGPFRNVHPQVKYVGDDKCVGCHEPIHRAYRQHPMGRSLVPVAQLAGAQLYSPAEHNPFEAFGITFRVDRQGGRVAHRQSRLGDDGAPIYDFAHEVDFAVGSGGRGHSYLAVRDGFVWQTPVSWFAQKKTWGLSPGFSPQARVGRPVVAACLFCHANHVEPVEHTRNRYHEPVFRGHAIGCERCHGPGGRHAETLAKDDIVNPRRLEPALREAVCQQCHLEGAARVLRRGRGTHDFRPGMPLEEFYTVFVRGPGAAKEHKAVSHAEQMYLSLCFQRSPAGAKMGCVSCHDPHQAVAPEKRVEHFRARCLQCHEKSGCSVPADERRLAQPQDSCAACHMPRFAASDIAHVASTDHRILRKAGVEPTNRQAGRPRADLPLLDFHRGAPDLRDRGAGRDLALAIYQLVLRGEPLSEAEGQFAVRLLGEALAEWGGDLPAWEAKGKLLQTLRQPRAAVEAYEAILARAPRHEGALATLGAIHRDQGQIEAALGYWRRAVEVNPQSASYRQNLALHLAQRGAWEESRPHARKWLDLDPGSPEARRAWVECLLREGKKAEAKAEFARLRALRPANLAKLEAWFAEQVR